MRKRCLFALIFWFYVGNTIAQNPVIISGIVSDSIGIPIAGANITIEGSNKGTTSSIDGRYELKLTAGQAYVLAVSFIGYTTKRQKVNLVHPQFIASQQSHTELNIILMDALQSIPEVAITGTRTSQGSLQLLDTKEFRQLPNPSGSIEALLKTLPGVSSNNELSTQYSVRGGNFDENLVYVNDVEIHRPMLIRSGQQEGLSFINPDLVASADFSAGGFDACYGDRMSSVLDVVYRTPSDFVANASLSLLGASASVEGTVTSQRFSYLAGVRYKTSQYLLGTLDTEGDYNPEFFDVQSLLRYQINEKWDMSLLANIARNKYHFIPESRSTNFGTSYESYNLKVYYDGQEVDHYNNGSGALTLGFQPIEQLSLKLTGSAYRSNEQETFDIEGAYRLSELEQFSGSSTTSDSTLSIGVGRELGHARNYLDAHIYALSHAGQLQRENHSLRWSLSFQQEITSNQINEWIMVDSAGYSVPYDGESIRLKEARYADNHLKTNRLMSYIQYQQKLSGKSIDWTLTAGLRLNYNDVNREWLLSPRLSLIARPQAIEGLTGHLSVGMYGQPPTYRELRNASGVMNPSMKAQRSIHYVVGGDYVFQIGQRPFKLSTELYYKQLSRLVPYRLENVRIYYAGDNLASGYVAGWDVKLNGEFVDNAESWVSFSLMHAREDIKDDAYGSFPLPTDQWVNFNLYFQDYIPGSPTWRMFLNLVYGSPLPYSYPTPDRYDQTFRMPSYRRVDIGLSKEFFKKDKPHKLFKQIWLNAEIFNLFDTNNTISYLWLQVVSNQDGRKQQYAVPNYLTSRRINIKLSSAF